MDDPSKHPLADRSAQGILPRTPFEAGLARRKRFFGVFLVATRKTPGPRQRGGIFFITPIQARQDYRERVAIPLDFYRNTPPKPKRPEPTEVARARKRLHEVA